MGVGSSLLIVCVRRETRQAPLPVHREFFLSRAMDVVSERIEKRWCWHRMLTLREWQYHTSPITEIMKMKPQTRPVTSAFWIFSSSKDFSFFSSRLNHKVRNHKFNIFHIINISLVDPLIGRTKLSRTTVFVISTETNKDLTWITLSFVFNPLFIQARRVALPQLHKN